MPKTTVTGNLDLPVGADIDDYTVAFRLVGAAGGEGTQESDFKPVDAWYGSELVADVQYLASLSPGGGYSIALPGNDELEAIDAGLTLWRRVASRRVRRADGRPEGTLTLSDRLLQVTDGAGSQDESDILYLDFLPAPDPSALALVQAALSDKVSKGDLVANILDFGGAVSPADSTAALLAALAAGVDVWFPAGQWKITGAIPKSALAGRTISGAGKLATTLLHAFNGDMIDMAEGTCIEDLTIDGQGATYTGKGLTFTSTQGNQQVNNARIINFDGVCLDFGADAGSGFHSTDLTAYRTSAGTGTGRYAIVIDPTAKLSAVPRTFEDLKTGGQCSINFGGCNNVDLVAPIIGDVAYTADSRAARITGGRILNQAALTMNGHNNSIVGSDVLPQITIASGADANTIGPGSFNNLPVIDNSGNDRNMIHHWAIAYVATLTSGGTAPSLGNGTLVSRYSRSGSTIHLEIDFTVGSTTTLGTGDLRFSLPRARFNGHAVTGTAWMLLGATNYTATAVIPGNVGYVRMIRDTTGSVTFNSPAVFAAGDRIRLTIDYNL